MNFGNKTTWKDWHKLGIYNPATNKAIFLGLSIYTLKSYIRVSPHCSIVKKDKRKRLGYKFVDIE